MSQRPIENIKSVTVLGKRYRFVLRRGLGDSSGYCNAPDLPDKAIGIDRNLLSNPRELCRVLIHETSHAADWYKGEEWIYQFSVDLERVLHRAGYRLAYEEDQ